MAHFHHPLLLLETFVDPAHFQDTLYKATNWQLLGKTQGYRRLATAYQANASPKLILVYPLQRNARRLLSRPIMNPGYHCGALNLMLTADQMKTLPGLFNGMPDPRRTQEGATDYPPFSPSRPALFCVGALATRVSRNGRNR
jgi:hypothetical protein